MNSSLTISFNPDVVGPVIRIKLEQEEWNPYVGYVSKAEAVKQIGNYLFGAGTFGSALDCGIEGQTITSVIYAYPYQKDLGYELFTSYGTLTGGTSTERNVQEITKRENLAINLDNEITLSYPALNGIKNFQWVGDVYDEEGQIVNKNSITYTFNNIDKIKLNKKVYGSLKLFYGVLRHKCELQVTMREEAIENRFSAVVYAIYSDGLVFLEISPPPGVEESAGYTGYDCGGSPGNIIPGDTPDVYGPKTAGADRYIEVNYCTQEVISDSIQTHTEY